MPAAAEPPKDQVQPAPQRIADTQETPADPVPIVATAPSTETADESWWTGGTLHDSWAAAWRTADHRDRLATTADWVSVLLEENKVDSMDELRVLADDMLECIDTAVEDPGIAIKMSAVASGCWILMYGP